MKLLAYGTLREGQYNFDRVKTLFGVDSIKKLGETTVKGFKLLDLGYYPAAVPCENSEIRCDILEVSEKANQFIDAMELGAGYSTELLNQEKIYVIKDQNLNFPKIESGDWLKK